MPKYSNHAQSCFTKGVVNRGAKGAKAPQIFNKICCYGRQKENREKRGSAQWSLLNKPILTMRAALSYASYMYTRSVIK